MCFFLWTILQVFVVTYTDTPASWRKSEHCRHSWRALLQDTIYSNKSSPFDIWKDLWREGFITKLHAMVKLQLGGEENGWRPNFPLCTNCACSIVWMPTISVYSLAWVHDSPPPHPQPHQTVQILFFLLSATLVLFLFFFSPKCGVKCSSIHRHIDNGD